MRVTDIFSFIFLNGNKIIYLFYNSVSNTISQWEAFNNGAMVVFSSIPDNSKRGFVLSYRGRKCHNPLKWISERYC